MKVPYLSGKRRSEMSLLTAELSSVINAHIDAAQLRPRLDDPWLKSMYYLLALLQVLPSASGELNPSKEYALLGASSKGDRRTFLAAMGAFQAPPEVIDSMRSAYQGTIFTGFIAELRSDLLMVLLQGIIYGYRGAAISMRCALEDLYRHLYYMDHPQEYTALTAGRETEYAMRISPIALREYLGRTTYLLPFSDAKLDFSKKQVDKDMDWFNINDDLYSALSSAVHGASHHWFAAVRDAGSLKQNAEKDGKLNELFLKFSKLCVTFLVAAHRDLFSSLGDYDKSIILEIYSSVERKNLRILLNL